jgi:hypothetical protein
MITDRGILEWLYIGMTFLAIVGVIQAAAARRGFKGMLFFPRPLHAYVFAVITVTGPLVALFLWNYWAQINQVAGSQQAGLFLISTIVAVIFTMTLGEIIHLKNPLPPGKPAPGLEALREGTFFRTFWRKITVKR